MKPAYNSNAAIVEYEEIIASKNITHTNFDTKSKTVEEFEEGMVRHINQVLEVSLLKIAIKTIANRKKDTQKQLQYTHVQV